MPLNLLKFIVKYLLRIVVALLFLFGLPGTLKYGLILLNSEVSMGKIIEYERTGIVCKPFELCYFSRIRYRAVIKFEDYSGKQIVFTDSFPVTHPYNFEFGPNVKVKYYRGYPGIATVIINTNILLIEFFIYLTILATGVRCLYALRARPKRRKIK